MNARIGLCTVTALIAAWLATTVSGAAERYALVVGVNAYRDIAQLQTARNDAEAVSKALSGHGFRMFTLLDPDRRSFSLRLSELVGSVRPGDEVLLYFAGHGVADAGTNYLLMADFPKLQAGQTGVLRDEAFSATEIMTRIKAAGARTTIAILDACRNNPLTTTAGRSIGNTRGLARVNPSQGSFVLFSADAGQQALDRLPTDSNEANSVFTRFLLPYMRQGTLTFPEIARAVRREVYNAARAADHDQLPAYYDALLEDFRLAAIGAGEEPEPPRTAAPIPANAFALLVGIDEYENHNDLKGAVADVQGIERALTSRGVRTEVMTDAAATMRTVRSALSRFERTLMAGDTFIFAFAGHGWKTDSSEKVWRLMMSDSPEQHSTEDLTTAQLAEAANRIAAKDVKVLLVIDAVSALGPVAALLEPGVTALLAQGDGKPFPEIMIEGTPHGALSWSVAQAADGKADTNSDGIVSEAELISFVRANVRTVTGEKQSVGVRAGELAEAALFSQ